MKINIISKEDDEVLHQVTICLLPIVKHVSKPPTTKQNIIQPMWEILLYGCHEYGITPQMPKLS